MERLKRVVIKEELVALTGDYRAAIVLQQFIYWSERVKDFDKFIEEENERSKKEKGNEMQETSGWIYKKAEELSEECMFITRKKVRKSDEYKIEKFHDSTILSYIDYLVEMGWIDKRCNPNHKWDRTLQYRLNLINLCKDLLKIGYILQDYKVPLNLIIQQIQFLDLQIGKCEDANLKIQNGSLEIQSRGIKIQDDNLKKQLRNQENTRAIPEITTETTTDITTEIISHGKTIDYLQANLLNSIKVNVSDTIFKTWFENLNVIDIADDRIVVETPNEFTKEILLSKHKSVINTALYGVIGKEIEVEFRVA